MPLSTIYHNGVRVIVFNATFYNISQWGLWYIVESDIKHLTLTPLWYIVESGIKHYNPNPPQKLVHQISIVKRILTTLLYTFQYLVIKKQIKEHKYMYSNL
jgi:hypothetical protein